MNKAIVLREYQNLVFDVPGKNDVLIDRSDWREIRDYVLGNPDADGKQAMVVGDQTIKAVNYVGVLQTRAGTTVEILPKVELDGGREKTEREREIFLRMLRRWRKSKDCIQLNDADVRTLKNFPLLEAFITMFMKDMHELTRRGLACAYNEIEENRHTLKGKLLIAPNLRHNLVHKERFYVRYEEFSPNRPINRLLKSTLLLLQRLSRLDANRVNIRRAQLYFEDIPASNNIDADLIRARVDRTMPLYNRLFPWARLFLKRAAPATWRDRSPALALLFPMEKIFEDYAAHLVRVAGGGWTVNAQESRYHLVTENQDGKSEFRLRPDIVARRGGQVRVMDAKWKRLDTEEEHYNISQTDLYQLYAYGKKYHAKENTAPELYLLYPRNKNFMKSLVYQFETGLCLTVVPVDLDKEKILDKSLDPTVASCANAA